MAAGLPEKKTFTTSGSAGAFGDKIQLVLSAGYFRFLLSFRAIFRASRHFWAYLAIFGFLREFVITTTTLFRQKSLVMFSFPLQVSTDSQLLVNSDIDNLQALRRAAEIAENAGVRLVVKPHPAEGDRLFVERLAALRHELGFLFVEGNTFQLMQHSSRVVTINSTAGMEAMLLGKPVTVLGRAMYEKFTIEDLACYMNYLIDVDYFKEDDLIPSQVSEIMERMQVGLEI